MKSRYLVLTAATALTICGAPTVNAKTKTVNLKVTTLKSGAKTISGKATPGAKIRVTRYAKTYAMGKATKQGTFKLKTKVKLKGGWHYKVTATKKGYQSKALKRYVVKPKTTNQNKQVTTLQSQIAALQQQLTQLQAKANGNVDVQNQITELKAQINGLKSDLVTVQAKSTQKNSNNKSNKNSSDNTEPANENKPVTPFDEKPTEYYASPDSKKIYMFPDMEHKGLATVIKLGDNYSDLPKTINVFAHLPKPKNNEDLPSWYNTNYPSSKFDTMLVEINGQKGFVRIDDLNLSSIAVGDSYYHLTNYPDYAGEGTMVPKEVEFTNQLMDGAHWTQITKNSKHGYHLDWYYHADTKTWDNVADPEASEQEKKAEQQKLAEQAKQAERQKAYEARQSQVQALSKQINELQTEINDTNNTISNYRAYSDSLPERIAYDEQKVAEITKQLENDPKNQDLQLQLLDSKSTLKWDKQRYTDTLAAKEKVGNGIIDWMNKLESLNTQQSALYEQRNKLQSTPY